MRNKQRDPACTVAGVMIRPMPGVFQNDVLAGRHAFVTGGGSGIGLAIAQRFATAGAAVSILGRNTAKLASALAQLEPGPHRSFAADVRDYAALAAALAEASQALGAIDILVCGAAGNFPAPALGMSANGFKAVIDIDVLGTFNTCRAAYEHLRKPGASILNISAAQAFRAYAGQAHVCAAKAGVDMLTRTLALEWGGAGVRVNSVTPGPIDGTEGMRRLAPDEHTRAAFLSHIPLRRFGAAPEIADLCLFLATPAAAFIHGAVVVCDGGSSLA